MTPEERDTVIEALENGRRVRNFEGGTKYQPDLEDAALAIMRRNPSKTLEQAWQAATLAERERAAKVCEEQIDEASSTAWNSSAEDCAAAIRKG